MTLKDLTIAKKVRKGESVGRNKQGSYWVAFSEKTACYGGDGIGQSAADIDYLFKLKHYRSGEVEAVIVRHSWHQNSGNHFNFIDAAKVLEMETVEDVLDYLAFIKDAGDRVYVDSSYRESMTKALEEFGLVHAKAPDEI
jgi:hypothetical protein